MDFIFTAFLFVAALTSSVVILAYFRHRGTNGHLSFCLGLALLAIETLFSGFAIHASRPDEALSYHYWRFLPLSMVPGVWVYFSLRYSRGEKRASLKRSLWLLLSMFLVPLSCVFLFHDALLSAYARHGEQWDYEIGWSGYILYLSVLIASAVLLVNLERTFRASTGTYRWRIKFIILGVATIFTARIYTSSQLILSHQHLPSFETINVAALLIGCILFIRGLFRKNIFKVEVYPSQKVLQASVATVLIGGYLLAIGISSKLLRQWEGLDALAFKSFLLVLSLAGLALVLLSERNRDLLRRLISRHLHRPMYDYRSAWLTFTERTASVISPEALSRILANWLSEQLHVLSTSVWLCDSDQQSFRLAASTGISETSMPSLGAPKDLFEGLRAKALPFEVDNPPEPWVENLKSCFPDLFKNAGNRVCVPLVAAGELVGFITLGDRVNEIPLGEQEFDLLKCVADQVASNLLNLQLSGRLLQAKEMEAFQTIATFFIHDLKNTASTLNLTLQNLPRHFDNPEFRKDALKSVSKSAAHIQELIARLTLFRQKLDLSPSDIDLNQLLQTSLGCLAGHVPVETHFGTLQPIRADEDQLQKVFTNLLLNARESMTGHGQITLSTARQNGWAIATVTDNGCGMSAEFITQSLFRPFKTTKKGGIGIGMFQTRAIIEAHKGKIEVESTPGQGTTFRIFLPETQGLKP